MLYEMLATPEQLLVMAIYEAQPFGVQCTDIQHFPEYDPQVLCSLLHDGHVRYNFADDIYTLEPTLDDDIALLIALQ